MLFFRYRKGESNVQVIPPMTRIKGEGTGIPDSRRSQNAVVIHDRKSHGLCVDIVVESKESEHGIVGTGKSVEREVNQG